MLRSGEFAVFMQQNRQVVVRLGILRTRKNCGAIMLLGLGPIVAFKQHRVVVMRFGVVRPQNECLGVVSLSARRVTLLFEKDAKVVVRLGKTRSKVDGLNVVLFGSKSITGDIEETGIPQPCFHIVGTQFDRLAVMDRSLGPVSLGSRRMARL